jgi:hypothetical protein
MNQQKYQLLSIQNHKGKESNQNKKRIIIKAKLQE